jgi:hypothetical protein
MQDERLQAPSNLMAQTSEISHYLYHVSWMRTRTRTIYRGAVFTIIATGPSKHHGLPGVNTMRESIYKTVQLRGRSILSTDFSPIRELQQSPWIKRAWTFQEGYLSKRLLVFTEHQVSFYCGTFMPGILSVMQDYYCDRRSAK